MSSSLGLSQPRGVGGSQLASAGRVGEGTRRALTWPSSLSSGALPAWGRGRAWRGVVLGVAGRGLDMMGVAWAWLGMPGAWFGHGCAVVGAWFGRGWPGPGRGRAGLHGSAWPATQRTWLGILCWNPGANTPCETVRIPMCVYTHRCAHTHTAMQDIGSGKTVPL